MHVAFWTPWWFGGGGAWWREVQPGSRFQHRESWGNWLALICILKLSPKIPSSALGEDLWVPWDNAWLLSRVSYILHPHHLHCFDWAALLHLFPSFAIETSLCCSLHAATRVDSKKPSLGYSERCLQNEWTRRKTPSQAEKRKIWTPWHAGHSLHKLVPTALLHRVTTPSPAISPASPTAGQLLCPLIEGSSTSVSPASTPNHTWGSWWSVVHHLNTGKYVTWFRLVTSDLNLMELSPSLIQCYPYSTAFAASPFVIYFAEPTDATEP